MLFASGKTQLCRLSKIGLPLIFIFFGDPSVAEPREGDAFAVIKTFTSALYTTAEKAGGNEAEWDVLERRAVEEMIAVLETSSADAANSTWQGRPLLHWVSHHGYLFLLRELLRHASFRDLVNLKDETGLTARDHAVLAMPQTLVACHPAIESPVVLVPYLVKLPYYASRQPFPEIVATLDDVGATGDEQGVRDWWIANCTNRDPSVLSKVRTSENLYRTLLSISDAMWIEKKTKEVEEDARILIDLVNMMPLHKRPSPEEIQEEVRRLYREKGLDPPD